MKTELGKMKQEINKKNYQVMKADCFGMFQELIFENIKVPKNPLNCKICDKKHKTGVLRPVCFCVKNTRFSAYQVFVKFKCSACNNVTYMRYEEYLNLVSPVINKIKKGEKEKREIEIIESIYHVNTEEAKKIKKENEENRNKMFRRLEQERNIRMIDYEDEDRQKKSEEKKRLIQSGELLYDKKNHVFYYKSTGKVYS